jgi:hypothetical protein
MNALRMIVFHGFPTYLFCAQYIIFKWPAEPHLEHENAQGAQGSDDKSEFQGFQGVKELH